MKFCSTRNPDLRISLSRAIEMGIAPDGGLFVPVEFPMHNISSFLDEAKYPEDDIVKIGVDFLKPFFEDDILESHLQAICANTFSFPIPQVKLSEDIEVLELFHGPTAAFKDVGARFLAQCFGHLEKKFTILVATSGDTGSAVASAFHKLNNVKVFILYPGGKISQFQERQLTFWSDNITALRVATDFDRCQEIVKQAFADEDLRAKWNLTSANSINIGRLLPQCIYYVLASIRYSRKYDHPMNVIVPSGNMGNVLAAIWVKTMGFPIAEIGIATNANTVLPDYFQTGSFEPRPSRSTHANAMDVGNPSNLERYLTQFGTNHSIHPEITSLSVTDEQILGMILETEKRYGYVVCPHTATAFKLYCKQLAITKKKAVIVSTAHPYKFAEVIQQAGAKPPQIPSNLSIFYNSARYVTDIPDDLKSLEKQFYR